MDLPIESSIFRWDKISQLFVSQDTKRMVQEVKGAPELLGHRADQRWKNEGFQCA
jgi:hypothetical protein